MIKFCAVNAKRKEKAFWFYTLLLFTADGRKLKNQKAFSISGNVHSKSLSLYRKTRLLRGLRFNYPVTLKIFADRNCTASRNSVATLYRPRRANLLSFLYK
jgi:hypothetical protein